MGLGKVRGLFISKQGLGFGRFGVVFVSKDCFGGLGSLEYFRTRVKGLTLNPKPQVLQLRFRLWRVHFGSTLLFQGSDATRLGFRGLGGFYTYMHKQVQYTTAPKYILGCHVGSL